jgi:WD40 repeat protein
LIKLWDLNDGLLLQSIEEPSRSIDISQDGSRLISVSSGNDASVKLWKLSNSTLSFLQTIGGFIGRVLDISISPDSKTIASGHEDTKVRLWDIETSSTIQVLGGHEDIVTGVDFSSDGKELVTASSHGVINLWDLENDQIIQTLETKYNDIRDVLFHPTERIIAWIMNINWENDFLHIWDLNSNQELYKFEGSSFDCMSFNSDGSIIAAGEFGSHQDLVRLWDTNTGELMRYFQYPDGILSIAFHPDNQLLAAGLSDSTVTLKVQLYFVDTKRELGV